MPLVAHVGAKYVLTSLRYNSIIARRAMVVALLYICEYGCYSQEFPHRSKVHDMLVVKFHFAPLSCSASSRIFTLIHPESVMPWRLRYLIANRSSPASTLRTLIVVVLFMLPLLNPSVYIKPLFLLSNGQVCSMIDGRTAPHIFHRYQSHRLGPKQLRRHHLFYTPGIQYPPGSAQTTWSLV
jgi:hypothetical protein